MLAAGADARFFEGVSPRRVAARYQPTLALSGSLVLEVDLEDLSEDQKEVTTLQD